MICDTNQTKKPWCVAMICDKKMGGDKKVAGNDL